MEKGIRLELSRYSEKDRSAIVYKTGEGYDVDLYIKDRVEYILSLFKKSEEYAENCAENWVLDQGLL